MEHIYNFGQCYGHVMNFFDNRGLTYVYNIYEQG